MTAILLAGLGSGVLFAALLAAWGRRRYLRAAEIVPGATTSAPRAWGVAHSPEARLHRRLREVVVALRALPGAGAGLAGGRGAVEAQVLALDERLVAVSALPASVRPGPLACVTAAVERLETSVADLAVRGIDSDGVPAEVALRRLSDEIATMAEAIVEVEALGSPPPMSPRTPPAGT